MRITHGLHPHVGQTCAITIGNFDGIHLGHQAMLKRLVAHAHAQQLRAAVVTFEPHPREWFAPDSAPARLSSMRDKLLGLKACGIEHVHVCPFNATLAHMPAQEFVENILLRGLGMRYLIIGDDFRFGAQRAGDFHLLQHLSAKHDYTLEAMPSLMVEQIRVSSTAIREALAAADFARAARLLGQPFRITGHVRHGEKRGRQLGFPTANLALKSRKPPMTGVFVVQVHGLAAQALPGVANQGVRPTLQAGLKTLLEVHLLDFSGDLYGRMIEVEFLTKLRDEQRFADLDALKRQIDYDVGCARDFFKFSAVR